MADVTIGNLPAGIALGQCFVPLSDTLSTVKVRVSALQVDYANITGKPAIPTAVSQLTNDSAYITASSLPATQQLARAWVNFNGANANGTNSPITGSYNVSSVYKNGNGDYTINFASAISGFAWSGSTGPAGAGDQSLRGLWEVSRTTANLRVRVQATNSGAQNPESNSSNSVIIFGS
jgi:hypothetical protein